MKRKNNSIKNTYRTKTPGANSRSEKAQKGDVSDAEIAIHGLDNTSDDNNENEPFHNEELVSNSNNNQPINSIVF